MKTNLFLSFLLLCVSSFSSCSQNSSISYDKVVADSSKNEKSIQTEPHRYGGWYCPDNLNGFPPIDIANWKKVPVVNGRMATKAETQNGASLIFVDETKYPNAKPLDIVMPKLASFYNKHSKRDELVIIIQAVNIDNDSIVGFRYLNGGNGSARLNEVSFLSDNKINMFQTSRFVAYDLKVKASPEEIWDILTKSDHAKTLQPTFDIDKKLKADWRETTNVNYAYPNAGKMLAGYGDKVYGNYYIQNDFGNALYTEKFLLLHDNESKQTELKIVCGPFGNDFDIQKSSVEKWAQKVKELSEKQ
ncbi:MAG: hypothetical protein WAT79_08195 [Saprospiraceae bacterium]